MKPNVTDEKTVASGKFLALTELQWNDANGVPRRWETATRRAFFGAVMIIPKMVPSGRLLVIRQYRPPAKTTVYEFPAGLINDGEQPEAAALRELREETGYQASVTRVFPPAYSTPGMADETVYLVEAVIDETLPVNLAPETEFDPSEMIETIPVPMASLPAFYRDGVARGEAFDAKLASYIIGLQASGC